MPIYLYSCEKRQPHNLRLRNSISLVREKVLRKEVAFLI